MPVTRDQEQILLNMLEQKFDQLKEKFVEDIKHILVDEIKKEMCGFVTEQTKKVEELESTTCMLQNHIMTLKEENLKLAKQVDEVEQYGRRLCLRIEGVPSKTNETSVDVMESVMEIIKETGESISEDNVDRAHRIGRKFKDRDTNEETQGIIVRFTAFKHRTQLYKARKRLKSVRIRLDMTTKRYNILKDARVIADGNQDKVKFVYADINCRLKVHPISGEDKYFSSCSELKDILLKSIQ